MNPYVKPFIPGQLSDSQGREIIEGDIIIAITEDNRPFWGLIVNKESGWGNKAEGPNPHLSGYSVLHGWGNFPSSLAWAKAFIVMDNCLHFGLKRPLIGDYDRCYELWTEQHRNDNFDKYIEKLKTL